MRKIESKHENPIDDVLIDLADKLCPTLKKWNFTPNIITTFSLITTIICLFFFNKRDNFMGCFFLIISYFFDCVDGHFARKYDMVTEFGDYFDHFTDLSLTIGLVYQLYKQNTIGQFKIKIAIMILFAILMVGHMGCQEKNHDKEGHSPTLSFSKMLCPDKTWIEYTRFFGSGTLIVIVCGLFHYEFGK